MCNEKRFAATFERALTLRFLNTTAYSGLGKQVTQQLAHRGNIMHGTLVNALDIADCARNHNEDIPTTANPENKTNLTGLPEGNLEGCVFYNANNPTLLRLTSTRAKAFSLII